jgi:hypothetical protein
MKDADLRRLLAIEQPALDWFRARAFGEDVSRQTETVNALKEAIRLNAWRPSVHDNAPKISKQRGTR